jgi:hypothetical protein
MPAGLLLVGALLLVGGLLPLLGVYFQTDPKELHRRAF